MYDIEQVNLTPLISIIVPVYNVKPYLHRCINSIINQTYENLEIILVDDGSTDGSSEICDIFQKQDKRIKFVHKKNEGLVSARKAGIQVAKGEYAAYVDSDDWVEADMYQQLLTLMMKCGADIVTSGVYREYQNNIISEYDNFPEGIYDCLRIRKEIFPNLMYTGNFYEAGINIHIYNKLFKRELLLKHQMKVDNAIRIGEDAAVVYPCFLDANKIVIMHKCFYHYCIRKNSIMASGYQSEYLGYKKICKIIKKQIDKKCEGNENLLMQLKYFMLYVLLLKEPQVVIKIDKGYLIPFQGIKIKERIILYGGGKFGCTLYQFINDNSLFKIVMWVDKVKDSLRGIESSSRLDELKQESYDKIIIAVLIKTVADEIQEELIKKGIAGDKIERINVVSDKIFEDKKLKELFEE